MTDLKKQIVEYFYSIDNKFKLDMALKYFNMYFNVDSNLVIINSLELKMVLSSEFTGYVCNIETAYRKNLDDLYFDKSYREIQLSDTFITNIVLHSKDEIQKNLNDMRGRLIKLEHDINKYDNLLKLI